jgi:hypothetical protein
MKLLACLLLAGGVLAASLPAQESLSRPNEARDRPLTASSGSDAVRMFFAMEPYVAHARASWPEARGRFLAGLPDRHAFFVTTRLRDAGGRIEQVFVAVDSVTDGRVHGRIWSQILVVEGYRLGQRYAFSEEELIDWMIARPDGTTEGNIVGRFLDIYRP